MTDGFRLEGRVAVITGAASGIGRGVAFAFAQAGCRVVVIDKNGDGAEATVEALKGQGAHALALGCDVSDPDSVRKAAAASEAEFGPCDILVNNAGVQVPGQLGSIDLATWNCVLGINLTGALLCSQAFGDQMRTRKRGSIVHVASIGADHPSKTAGSYSVTKAGLVMLSRVLAIEWAADGIRSNAVKPGMIRTGLTEAAYRVPGLEQRRSAVIPAGRIGEPEDLAGAVLFLASDLASYITGQELVVDGGFERMLNSMIPRP
jgi:NAD(P)-dependent dehydrogenase (short-subunit alcohol dehydrogenase family)